MCSNVTIRQHFQINLIEALLQLGLDLVVNQPRLGIRGKKIHYEPSGKSFLLIKYLLRKVT